MKKSRPLQNEDKFERIEKKYFGKNSTKDGTKSKRVCFSWVKNDVTCKIKAYIAFVVDEQFSILKYIRSDDLKLKRFKEMIIPKINEKFPHGYKIVKEYYHSKGKKLIRSHYENLLYARLCSMYTDGFSHKTEEHPSKTTSWKLRGAYKKFCVNDFSDN